MSHNIVYALRVMFFLAILLTVGYAIGAPIFEASHDGVRIVVYDEPCKLPAVANLPRRATWAEKGKTFEGCAGISPIGVVMFFFDDKTVAAVPVQAFTRVTGA